MSFMTRHRQHSSMMALFGKASLSFFTLITMKNMQSGSSAYPSYAGPAFVISFRLIRRHLCWPFWLVQHCYRVCLLWISHHIPAGASCSEMDLIINKKGNKKVFLFSKTKLFEVLTIQDVCELNFRSCCEMHVEICSPAAGAAARVSMRGMNSAVKEQTTTGNLGLDSIRNIGSAKTFLLR